MFLSLSNIFYQIAENRIFSGFISITHCLSQGLIVILLLDTFPRLQTVFFCLRLLVQPELCPVYRNEQAIYCEPGLAMTNNKEEIDNADQ